MPQRMRYVLPLPAGDPSAGDGILQEQPPQVRHNQQDTGPSLLHHHEEGTRFLLLPEQEKMLDIRQQTHVLQAVPVPFLCGRQNQRGTRPLVQRCMDGQRQRRRRRGEGPCGGVREETRIRDEGSIPGVQGILRHMQGGGGYVRRVRDPYVPVRKHHEVHRSGIYRKGHG